MWWEDDGYMVDALTNWGYEVVYPEETEIKDALKVLYDLQKKRLLSRAVGMLKQLVKEGVFCDGNGQN